MAVLCRRLGKAQAQLGHRREALPLSRAHKGAAAGPRRRATRRTAAAVCRALPFPGRNRGLGCRQAGHRAWGCRQPLGRHQRRLPVHWVPRRCSRAAASSRLRLLGAAVVSGAVGGGCGGRGGPQALCKAGVWVPSMRLQHGSHGGGVVGALHTRGQPCEGRGGASQQAAAAVCGWEAPKPTGEDKV